MSGSNAGSSSSLPGGALRIAAYAALPSSARVAWYSVTCKSAATSTSASAASHGRASVTRHEAAPGRGVAADLRQRPPVLVQRAADCVVPHELCGDQREPGPGE